MSRRRSLSALIGLHFAPFRKSQRTTITVLTCGLLLGRRLGLAAIARYMPGPVSVRHKIKRAGRFADNKRVHVHQATTCLLGWALSLCRRRPVVALDWTVLPRKRVMLTAAVALGGRAVPVAWTVMAERSFNSKRHNGRNNVEEKLILRLHKAFAGRAWTLTADRGFARASLFSKLNEWGIDYVIRTSGNLWVATPSWSGRLYNIRRWPGCCERYGRALYQKSRQVPVSLVVTHSAMAPEPWYLVTNLRGSRAVEKVYQRRMWIEEHFRDVKSGLGLGRIRLKRAHRIERLLIIAAVAILVGLSVGMSWQQCHGHCDMQLTSHKRGRSLSLLNLGYELIRRILIGQLPSSLVDKPLPLGQEGTS